MDRPRISQTPSEGRKFPLIRPTTSAAGHSPSPPMTRLPSPFEDDLSSSETPDLLLPESTSLPLRHLPRLEPPTRHSAARQSFSGIHIVVEELQHAPRGYTGSNKKSARRSALFRHRSREALREVPRSQAESPRLLTKPQQEQRPSNGSASASASWFMRAANATFRGRRRSTFGESGSPSRRPLLDVPTRASPQIPDSSGAEGLAPARPGEAARASAAASNERLEALRPPPTQPPPLLPKDTTAMLRRMKSSDNESGIGIDLQEPAEAAAEDECVIPRVDPAIMPEELFHHVLSHLDADSLMQAELVSRRWHSTAGSRAMWRGMFAADFGSKAASVYNSAGSSPSSPPSPSSQTGPPLLAPQVGGLGLGHAHRPTQLFKQMWKTRTALDARWRDGHAAALYLHGHQDSVYCVQFDEAKIVTGSRDRTIRVWDLKTLQCTKVLGLQKTEASAAAAQHPPLGSRMARQRPFASFDACPLGRGPAAEPRQINHAGSVLCLQFDSTTMVSGSSDTTLIVWDVQRDWQPVARLVRHTAGVLDVCFDARRIVSCSKDTTVCVWERGGSHALLARLTSHLGPVNAVQLRGEHLVSASGDGVAKLWNLASATCVKEFPSRDRGLACVEFSPDSRTILAGGNDHVVYQFDANSGELVRELRGHSALVRSLHLDPVNARVVSGSYDYSVKAYDLVTGKLLCDFLGWTSSWILSAKADYRRIVATSQDGRVVVMDFGHGLQGVDLLDGAQGR